MKSTRLATLCVALGLASFFSVNAHAAITVDGTKDADYGTALATQTINSGWGAANTLASLSASQQGGSLYVFIAGRPQGNAFMLFIDSKPGGINFIPNNLIAGGGEENSINNFGSSGTAGMTFESGFQPDYAVRVFGDGGGGTGAWVNLYTLTPGSNRAYLGNSGTENANGGPVTLIRTVWQDVSNVSTADKGSEIQFSLAGLGVPSGTGQPIKMMVMLVSGDSGWGSNQVLGSLPAGSGDLQGNMRTLNFNSVTGTQTISTTVDNTDSDGDGEPDATDTDDDNDGLADTVETKTGTFVDANNTGTDPLLADTDGDGFNDGAEVNGTSSLARVTSPLKKNYATMLVAGNFLTPTWSDTPTSSNTMNRVSGQEFAYTINYNFRSVGTFEGKFVGNSWSTSWGDATPVTPGFAVLGGANFSFVVGATGFYTANFNHDTLAYSFGRTVFADFAAYATAYALTGDESADDDSDGITNGAEFTANTDPTRANDALPPVITLASSLVALEAGSSYTADAATATDNVDGNISPNISNNSATILDATALSTPGTYTVTYSVTDAAGNTGTKAQTVVVHAVGAFASQYSSIAVPGNFNGWTTDGSAGNALKKMANFTWHGIKYFTTNNANGGFKFLANGAWNYQEVVGGVTNTINNKQWAPAPLLGASGNSDLAANVTTNGWYLFAVTEANDTASVTRVSEASADGDGDGIPDVLEAYFGSFLTPAISNLDPAMDYNNNQKTALQDYQQGINPTQDTIAPTLELASGVEKLVWLALNSNGGSVEYTDADAVAASEVPGETPNRTLLHRLVAGGQGDPGTYPAVDTAAAGLWRIEYTASDDFGNATTLYRTVVVGDQVPASPSGWYGLNYPASATISTMGSVSVYAQIYVADATPGTGQAPNIQCWIGVSNANTDPSTWDTSAWTPAAFNPGQTGNNDEYSVPFSGAALGAGTHYYAARWQIGSGAFFYGGIDTGGNGNAWNAATHPSGVLTVNAAVAREVTFAVDMGVQAFRGAFTPGTDAVYLVGDVTNWSTGTAMVREGETSVYKLTLNLEGAENATLNYKFKSANTAVGNGGFEGDLDAGVPGDTPRVLSLGAAAVAQNLTTANFNNQTEARKLTLRVDMTTQIAKGNFDAASNSVSVVGSFNGYSTTANLAAPAPGVGTNVYSATLILDGPQSGNLQYKFFNNRVGAPNSGYEITRENANRILAAADLGANLTETVVSAVPLFSNDDGVGPTLSLNGSATVNLNVGDAFTDEGATATDVQDGTCTVNTTGSVNTSAAGTYTLTYTSFDVAGNASVPTSVTRTVVVAAASGSTFAGWSGGDAGCNQPWQVCHRRGEQPDGNGRREADLDGERRQHGADGHRAHG